MKVYFGGSISGGRDYLDTYRAIVDFLKTGGHEVLTEHVVHPDVLELEKAFTDQQVYTRDIRWLESCGCLIAEVSNPSLGVGYEIRYALELGKPVLSLYRDGIFLSRMLTGNTSTGFTIKPYKDDSDWKKIIGDFLNSLTDR